MENLNSTSQLLIYFIIDLLSKLIACQAIRDLEITIQDISINSNTFTIINFSVN